MKILLTAILSFLLFIAAAQDINALLKEAARLETLPNEKASLEKFKEVLKLQPTNLLALTKCSELCSRIGKREASEKSAENYYLTAKNYATAALKINPANSDANCVMAIALGRIALSKSGKEKLNSAKEIKRYTDAALKYDPANFKAWHVLGKWHYELSTLNFFERTIVKVVFGGLPPASLKESIAAFEKAKNLSAGFLLNYLEMSKAYKENDQNDKAIAALTTLLQLPSQTEDDPIIKKEGRKLLEEWQ
ncbi:MAG: hypothetical protein QM791_12555 [Ferruginibacter sp.]